MTIDTSLLRLEKVKNYKSVPFAHLQQLYEFEFSTVTHYELNPDGLYDPEMLKSHWSKQGVDIYVLYYKAIPIGFTVVNLASMIDGDPHKKDIAEMFVMPNYRRQHVGEWMTYKIFAMYKGSWEVRQLAGLAKARAFWLRVIERFTQNQFEELHLNNDVWHGTLQRFEAK
ncbi:MAG: hypothetical protein Tsb005_21070 [Gammaproteobacteria bacterium]